MQKAAQLPSGTEIDGRYRIKRCLGAGGYGEVYLAQQLNMGREVALKVMHARLAQDPRAVRRFEREARQACHLKHPHTVIYYDSGADDALGILYLAMEYLEGESLSQRLRRSGALSASATVSVLEQICGSLHEAHQMGLVHRDVKPGNVMLVRRAGRRDYVKVIDFGIAKSVNEELSEAEELTASGTIIGSPSYMAPEQVRRQEHPLGPQTDIYALACMAYKMLTGLAPFRGSGPIEIATQHLTTAPPPISALTRRALPAGLDGVLLRALAKNPERRPATAPEFAQQLRQALDSAAPVPDPVDPLVYSGTALMTSPTQAEVTATTWTRQHKRRAALLGLVVCSAALFLMVAVGVVFKQWRDLKAQQPPNAAQAATVPPGGDPQPDAAPPQPDAAPLERAETLQAEATAPRRQQTSSPKERRATAAGAGAKKERPAGAGAVAAAPKVAPPTTEPAQVPVKPPGEPPARSLPAATPAPQEAAPTRVTQQAPRAASVPVVITSKTWARKITIQGGPSTEKRFLKANLKPGRYTILIQRYETRRHTITVKADGPNRFSL